MRIPSELERSARTTSPLPLERLSLVLLSLAALVVLGSSALSGCGAKSGAVEPGDAGTSHPATMTAAKDEEAVSRHLRMVFVADLHAQLEAHPELFWNEGGERIEEAGGFARVAAFIEGARREHPGAVLAIDGGDTIQGSGAAALTEGEVLLPILPLMGFELAIPGNWEVVYGPAVMNALTGALPYPTIATNVYEEATGERVFAPYWIGERGGVRVAVVGFTDPDVPFRQPPAYSRGLSYTSADEEQLSELAATLREEQGAEVVVLVSHLGLSKAVALSERLRGYDVHLSADTHERTYEPVEVGGTWVVEPGAFGSFAGVLDFEVNEEGEVSNRSWELVELTASRFPEDEEVARAIDEALVPLREELDRELGQTGETLIRYGVVETSVDALLADALRASTGADIALSNGFRFGTPLLPGPITVADLWNLYPIVTPVKSGEVTGAQLRAFWERELENVFAREAEDRFGGWVPRPSGMELVFEAGAPVGQRIQSITFNGEPLHDEEVYTVTACEREGDRPDMVCRIPDVANPRVHDFNAHEAVERYLRAHPEVSVPALGRVRATDIDQPARSQAFITFEGPHEHGESHGE